MIFLVIFLALIVRLQGILQGNFAFTYDTGRDLLAVRDLVTTGDIHLIGHTTGIIGVFYGPWWYWLLTPIFLLTGGNPLGMTSAIAVLGALSAGIGYLWGEPILGILLSLSPGIVKITNQLWNPHMIVPTTLLALILIKDIDKRSKLSLVALGFILGLLTEFEIIFGILFIIGFLLTRPKRMLPIFFGFFVIQTPRILFELRNGFVQTKAFLGGFGTESVWQLYTKRAAFIYESLSSVLPGPPWMQLVLIMFIGILILKNKNKTFILKILTIVAVFWVAVFLYPRDIWPYYLFGLPVLYAVIVSFVLQRLPKFITVVYFLFLLQPQVLISSVIKPAFVGDAAVFHNQQEVVQTIFRESKTDFKYIAYTPPQIDYSWKYLIWRENTKKHAFGLSEDPPIMYVIIEPDDAYPERLNEWLKVRAKDGVVVSEKKFPSGIIVQTRRLRWN